MLSAAQQRQFAEDGFLVIENLIDRAKVLDSVVAEYEAALDGMLIAGHDEGVLEIYRGSDDGAEKKELLEYLVIMGSDEVWDLIDAALMEGGS